MKQVLRLAKMFKQCLSATLGMLTATHGEDAMKKASVLMA